MSTTSNFTSSEAHPHRQQDLAEAKRMLLRYIAGCPRSVTWSRNATIAGETGLPLAIVLSALRALVDEGQVFKRPLRNPSEPGQPRRTRAFHVHGSAVRAPGEVKHVESKRGFGKPIFDCPHCYSEVEMTWRRGRRPSRPTFTS